MGSCNLVPSLAWDLQSSLAGLDWRSGSRAPDGPLLIQEKGGDTVAVAQHWFSASAVVESWQNERAGAAVLSSQISGSLFIYFLFICLCGTDLFWCRDTICLWRNGLSRPTIWAAAVAFSHVCPTHGPGVSSSMSSNEKKKKTAQLSNWKL